MALNHRWSSRAVVPLLSCALALASGAAEAKRYVVFERFNNDLNGVFSTNYRQRFGDNAVGDESDKHLSTAVEANGRADLSGYVWRPWFSRLALNGMMTVREEVNSFDQNNSNLSVAAHGRSEFTLYPDTRFPFAASLGHTNSAIDADFGGQDYQITQLRLQQNYTPRDHLSSYVTTFRHSVRDAESVGDSSESRIDFGLNKRIGHHQFSGSADYTLRDSQSTTGGGDNEFTEYRFYGSHSLSGLERFSLNTTFDSYDLQEDLVNGGGIDEVLDQVSTTARWQPREHGRLNLFGNLRLSQRENGTGGNGAGDSGTSENNIYFSNVVADYRLSERVSLYGSLDLMRNEFNADAQDRFGQRLGATYNSLGVDVAGFNYQWHTGTNFSNTMQSGVEDGQVLGVDFGQNVFRNLPWWGESGVDFRLSQSVATQENSLPGQPRESNLVHQLALSHSYDGGGTYNMWQLSADDSRRLTQGGEDDSTFQTVNLQWSSRISMSRNRELSSNLTAQLIMDDSSGGTDVARWIYSGDLTYVQNHIWGVRDLRFDVRLYLLTNQLISARTREEIGEINFEDNFEEGFQDNNHVEMRLVYRVGKLEAALSARYEQIDQGGDARNNGSFMFTLRRYFDRY